jgi:hypothetical protein
MLICNEIELTKDEILATIDALVVCFDIEKPVEIRLIWSTISAENLGPNDNYSK